MAVVADGGADLLPASGSLKTEGTHQPGDRAAGHGSSTVATSTYYAAKNRAPSLRSVRDAELKKPLGRVGGRTGHDSILSGDRASIRTGAVQIKLPHASV